MNPVDRIRADLVELGLGDVVLELDDSAATAPLAAAAIGAHYGMTVPVGAIVKSLVFMIDGQPVIVLGTGDRNVDQKRLAEVYGVGRKKVKLADAATALAVTGFEVGGVAPIGHTRPLPVVIDQALARFETVWAAAGAHHAVFPISYQQLVQITAGRVAALSSEAAHSSEAVSSGESQGEQA
jgi:prolyl-tRNA editing enzyme YbaK/EbsC (Cys-tRNA(Pro) deacylase)